ncbi:3-oxoadipate enol-lactonase [Azorhizobium doebereinerae]|uniref:3-oxoadipate enol-lactonase n=1 Tax=Azorhizobium doebereinerae TaxID=281091 RepID=UPI000414F2C8|nr:3-oxoadipate enol-lactonase [Azorhizobium doebereinerae]
MTTTLKRIAVEPGVSLQVRVSGTPGKPALLLSNSLTADLSTWDEVETRLAPHAFIIGYDTRGHGRSDAPGEGYTLGRLGADAIAILDALSIPKAVVCGLSLGGLTAMWLGAHVPDRVAGLVLANTAANFPPPGMWEERARAALERGLAPFVAPALERWFTAGFRAAAPERVAQIARVIGATSPAGYAGCCRILAHADVGPDLAAIACPTLVIAGTHDPSTPPARAEEICAGIAGAELVCLDAAHLSAVEAPEAFAAAVQDFLLRTRAD